MKRHEQVFPLDSTKLHVANGLTKRELFAAFALSGIIQDENMHPMEAAISAVEAADALLTALCPKEMAKYCEVTGMEY